VARTSPKSRCAKLKPGCSFTLILAHRLRQSLVFNEKSTQQYVAFSKITILPSVISDLKIAKTETIRTSREEMLANRLANVSAGVIVTLKRFPDLRSASGRMGRAVAFPEGWFKALGVSIC
jgi:hypothetical protein